MPGGYLEQRIFTKEYRRMIANLKKFIRQDAREEEKLSDIRTSEGSGRKGSASLPSGIPQIRQPRGNSGKKPGPANNEKEENSDAGAASSTDAAV